MTKKTAKPKAKPEAKPTEPEPIRITQAAPHVVVGGLPPFNFNARPITNEEVLVTDTPIRPSYESIQQEARGPGVEKCRRIDKLRADLTNLYNSLREDTRYTEEHKAELAWSEYEKVSPQIQQLTPEAHQEMLKNAEDLERQSIPTPEGEHIYTSDTNKLLLTAHKRSRLEGLINRVEKAADKGPFKANPADSWQKSTRVGSVRAALGAVQRCVLSTSLPATGAWTSIKSWTPIASLAITTRLRMHSAAAYRRTW
jgi:hypothetical protein